MTHEDDSLPRETPGHGPISARRIFHGPAGGRTTPHWDEYPHLPLVGGVAFAERATNRYADGVALRERLAAWRQALEQNLADARAGVNGLLQWAQVGWSAGWSAGWGTGGVTGPRG
jgi:hypothetical protein